MWSESLSTRETVFDVPAQGIFPDNRDGGRAQGRIAGNTISDFQTNFGAIGILIRVSEVFVSGNRVQGMNGTFARGLNDTVNGTANGCVERNTFEHISGSQFPGEGVKIDSSDVSSLTVIKNNPLPPVGLKNAVGTTVDAECHYWDSPSGPAPVGSGSDVVGAVHFRPWSVGRIGNGNTCRGRQWRQAKSSSIPTLSTTLSLHPILKRSHRLRFYRIGAAVGSAPHSVAGVDQHVFSIGFECARDRERFCKQWTCSDDGAGFQAPTATSTSRTNDATSIVSLMKFTRRRCQVWRSPLASSSSICSRARSSSSAE